MPPQQPQSQVPWERIATLEANYKHMDDKTDDMAKDIKEMLEFMQQTKGGWRVLAGVAAIAGAVGGILAKVGLTWLK